MDTDPLQIFLNRQGFVMLDGGLATEMEKHDANLDDDLWSAKMLIESPELIRQVHSDFLKSGADIIATATYQASFEGFEKAGYHAEQAECLMRLGVDLAVLACESFWAKNENHTGRIRPLVAASIGPYGATLHDGSEYHGNYGLDKKHLKDFHRPRMQILADTAADLFAFETIPSRLEAEALIELMQEFPAKQAWLSFSCKDEKHVSHGELFADCVALVEASDQMFAAGVNCTDPEYVDSLLESVDGNSKPLAVYPNSGEQWNSQGNQWMGDGCATMPVQDWYDRGARLIGGCCRTTMEEITRMRSHLTRYVGRVVNEQ
jgi:homocysteine S-methyltransferase